MIGPVRVWVLVVFMHCLSKRAACKAGDQGGADMV